MLQEDAFSHTGREQFHNSFFCVEVCERAYTRFELLRDLPDICFTKSGVINSVECASTYDVGVRYFHLSGAMGVHASSVSPLDIVNEVHDLFGVLVQL